MEKEQPNGRQKKESARTSDLFSRTGNSAARRNPVEENLYLIFDTLFTDFLTVQDTGYRILRYNKIVRDTFGDRLEGMHCYRAYQKRDAVCPDCPVEKVIRDKKPASGVLPNPNGMVIEIHAYPIFDDDGELIAVMEHGRDVSKRINAEKALQRSLAYNRSLIEASLDPLVTISPDGRITDVNAATETVTGRAREALIGTDFIDYFTDPERARAGYQQVFREGSVRDYALEIQRPDGGATPVLYNASVYRDDEGNVLGVFAAARDVTELKKKTEELRQSEELLSKILDILPVGLFLVDQKGGITRANPAALQIWEGVKLGDFDDWSEYKAWWPKTGAPVAMEEWAGAHALRYGKVTINDEVEIETFRGTRKIIHNSAIPIRNSRQEIVGAIIVEEDITQRKRAEEALRDSEADMKEAQRVARVGSWKWDPKTDTVTWSEELYRIAGLDPASPAPNFNGELEKYYTPESWERLQSIVKHALRTGQSYQADLEVVRPDGTTRWIAASGEPVFDAGRQFTGLRGTVVDITGRMSMEKERRDLENRVWHAQKLESLGVLAGGIAHDFNNLLMAILGHTDLSLSKVSSVSPIRDHLDEIGKASRRAADLCRQMLAYSGKGKFVVSSLDLGEVVIEMSKILEVSVSKKAALQYRFSPDLPRIEADVAQIQQVIMNLIINASESIGDNSGVITISIGAMECDKACLRELRSDEELPEGLYVTFEVSDTGCGMDDAMRAKIFDPFFTTKFTGRGLGLAAVLGIVRGHRGAIKVCSEPGKGSSFQVLFPASKKAAASPSACGDAAQRESAWKGSGTILLADDEEMVRQVGKGMLEALGFHVLSAVDGVEALDLFRGHRDEIVCVLLDLTMPRMDGEEAYRKMRLVSADIPILLSSGYNEQHVSQRFAGNGPTGFIQKPYRMNGLAEKLSKILSRNR